MVTFFLIMSPEFQKQPEAKEYEITPNGIRSRALRIIGDINLNQKGEIKRGELAIRTSIRVVDESQTIITNVARTISDGLAIATYERTLEHDKVTKTYYALRKTLSSPNYVRVEMTEDNTSKQHRQPTIFADYKDRKNIPTFLLDPSEASEIAGLLEIEATE